jgi:hypothetical protein
MTNAQRISSAISSRAIGVVEALWSTDLPEEVLADAITDALYESARVVVGWSDFGIGSYECRGARGTDINWQPEVDDEESYAVVAIRAPAGLTLPSLRLTMHGGGCTGDHPGPCHLGCRSWDTDVRWRPIYTEKRDDGWLYAIYQGS